METKLFEIIGVFEKDGKFYAKNAMFEHLNEEEYCDSDSALLALNANGNENWHVIFAQNSDGTYVGITTKETSKNYDSFWKNHKEKYNRYVANYSVGHTNKDAVDAIKKDFNL